MALHAAPFLGVHVEGASAVMPASAAEMATSSMGTVPSWQLQWPFAIAGALDTRAFLLYIYGHLPVFAWFGFFYSKNGSLDNSWPPSKEKLDG